MNKLVHSIITVLVVQTILIPGQALAQVSGWSASSSGSGIGPSSITTQNGPANTPGTVGATFAPQGGVGLQNYGNANISVTGTSTPTVSAGTVATTFAPQGGTGIQNYGSVNLGGLPSNNAGTKPGAGTNSNVLPGSGVGIQPATSSNPGGLPNTGIVPLPGFGSSASGQSGAVSGSVNNSHP